MGFILVVERIQLMRELFEIDSTFGNVLCVCFAVYKSASQRFSSEYDTSFILLQFEQKLKQVGMKTETFSCEVFLHYIENRKMKSGLFDFNSFKIST